VKRIRHIPDVARLGYTYCGRFYVKGTLANMGLRLALIDLARDCIEDAPVGKLNIDFAAT